MKQLQLARGTTALNDAYTGAEGELVADLDRWELRLHDGETPGGHRICNLDQLTELFMSKDSEFGHVVFNEADRGILTRIGDKQYALRLLKGIEGILITTADDQETTNENGETANFYIGLDPAYIANLITTAGRIAWCGTTAGNADAFTVTAPDKWTDRDGAVLAFKFHTAGNDAATLAVTIGTGDDATTLTAAAFKTANGSTLMSHTITQNRIVVAMRVGDSFYLIGEGNARDIGIETITGLNVSEGVPAKNVQEALEALQAEITGIGGDTDATPYSFFKFDNPSNTIAFTTGNYKFPLKTGECKMLWIAPPVQVSTGGGDSAGTVTGGGEGLLYMITRAGDAIWLHHVRDAFGTGVLQNNSASISIVDFSIDNLYTRANWIKAPFSVIDADYISLGSGTFTAFNLAGYRIQPSHVKYSSAGVVTNPLAS